jgi:TctA family transporter
LALANVFGASLCIFLSKPIARLTVIPFTYLAPFMILIITLASYQASRGWGDLIALLVMGILGWVMKQYGWPRPAALIGYVLSDNIETYLFISVQRYGLSWIARRGVIILALIIIASLAMGVFWQRKKAPRLGGDHAK